MIISQVQQNTLDELVKTGCGRAAELMSMLMGKPVLLETPRVSFHALDELSAHLEDISPHEVATVHQVFGGSISGDALLVLDYKGASILVDLLSGGPGIERTLTASDREAILEVGNILLNACAGSLAAWLNARLTFTAPAPRFAG